MSYASRVIFSGGKVGVEDATGERVSEEGRGDVDEVGECVPEEEVMPEGEAAGASVCEEERGVYAIGGGVAEAGQFGGRTCSPFCCGVALADGKWGSRS